MRFWRYSQSLSYCGYSRSLESRTSRKDILFYIINIDNTICLLPFWSFQHFRWNKSVCICYNGCHCDYYLHQESNNKTYDLIVVLEDHFSCCYILLLLLLLTLLFGSTDIFSGSILELGFGSGLFLSLTAVRICFMSKREPLFLEVDTCCRSGVGFFFPWAKITTL